MPAAMGIGNECPYHLEKGDNGEPLANPIWWTHDQKWTFGQNPQDISLLETCTLTLPEGYSYSPWSTLKTDDHTMHFIQAGPTLSRQFGIMKYKWVPNGASEVQTAWADNGWTFDDGYFGYGCAGVETDGNYLYTAAGDLTNTEIAESDFRYWDIDDGTMLKKIDLKEYWCLGGTWYTRWRLNSGPNVGPRMTRDDHLILSSGNSDTYQILDPLAGFEDDTELINSINGNGDCVGDALVPGVLEVCGPQDVYVYDFEVDKYNFQVFPCYDMGAVSFALVAPDGTGVQYMAYAG